MLFVVYTGRGWMTYFLVPAVFSVGIAVGLSLDTNPGAKYVGAGLAAVIVAVVGGTTQWLLGRRFNGDISGRSWHLVEHTTYGVPMELTAPFYPAVGLVMLAIVVGAATSRLWGWLLFVAALIPAGLLVQTFRRRRPRV